MKKKLFFGNISIIEELKRFTLIDLLSKYNSKKILEFANSYNFDKNYKEFDKNIIENLIKKYKNYSTVMEIEYAKAKI